MKKVILLSFILALHLYSAPYKTIETNGARIVFQDGLEKQAKEVANYIATLKPYYENGNKLVLKKIPILIEKGNSISNGYFNFGPNRLRFYPIPYIGNELGKTPWLKLLSIHEYRHYTQSQLAQQNWVSKMLYYLNGSVTPASLANITIPMWVWEGDAIYYETKLTNDGRGRNPSFLKWYRALLEDGKKFSYNKAKNSSYKELMPNHYYLGYILISYGTEKYGNKFWDEVIKKGGYLNSFTPFSNALKELTGMDSEEFYKNALEYFAEKYKVDKTIEYEEIIKNSKYPTLSTYPYEYDGGIVYMKLDFDKNTGFYTYKDGKEKQILNLGFKFDETYQLRGDTLIWTDIVPDKTNPKKSYSNIEVYNIKNKEKKTLSKDGTYFSPSYSHLQDRIAVINNNGVVLSKISILDAQGKFIQAIPNGEEYFYNYIDWSENDKNLIVSLRNKKGEMALVTIDLESFEQKELIPFGQYIIKAPKVQGENIYFTGAFDLVENVYRYSLEDKNIYKVTESNIGTVGGSLVNGELYFSEYSSKGYSIKKSKDLVGKEFTPTSLLDDKVMNLESFKNTDLKLDTSEKESEHEVKSYNYLKHMVKFNSWDFGTDDKKAYLSLMSANELEDFNLNIFYEKDKVNNSESFKIQGVSSRYWPNTSFTYENRWGSVDKNEFGLGLSFPINLSKGNLERKINLNLNYLNDFDGLSQYQIDGNFYNGEQKSIRDLVSENSQKLELIYTANLENEKENKLSFNYNFTTIGIFENDGFIFGFDSEEENGTVSDTKESISPRGYKIIEYDKATKINLDYVFPIAYPDIGKMGLFLNKVSGGLYYDKAYYDGDRIKSTLGTKANFDITIFALLPASLELQYNYLLEEKNSVVNLSFKVNN